MNFGLDTFVNFTKTDQVQSIVSFSIIESLFRLIRCPLYSLLHFIHIFFPLKVLILERVPVK